MSAFWGTQSWSEGPSMQAFKLCPTLTEEVVTCLLGGHGAPAEVGLAAAARVIAALRDTPDAPLSRERAEELLTTPLEVNGRLIHYRFAAQRAQYLSGSLAGFAAIGDASLDDIELRDALCALQIGSAPV